jgi:hypothetical protein
MMSKDDELQAQALADKIVNDVDKGVSPNPADVESLAALVESHSKDAADALRRLKESDQPVSVADMFEMQMLMNHLSQLSEMSTNVVNSANAAILSMTRNLKG